MESKQIREAQYDSWYYYLDKLPIATHMYYMDQSLWGNKQYNLAPFAQSGVVLNLLYMPFLSESDLDILKIPYDQEHYGTVKDDPQSEVDYAPECNVFKIMNQIKESFDLNTLQKYPSTITSRPKTKDWKNESKLYQFPYSYITINDYINTPLKLQYHLITTTDIKIKARQPLTVTGGYTIYVDGYKGDKNHGANEGMLASAGLDLPTSSSQYSQFMATSKASFIAQNEISERNENVGMRLASQQMGASIAGNIASGVIGAFSSDAGGNIGGAVAGGINAINQYSMTEQQIKKDRQNYIDSAHAQLTDLKRSPRTVNLTSSDILMSLDRNSHKIVANRYSIQEYYKNKLCDYFTLFGYKQNKLMNNDKNKLLKSRKYFNYIKTLDANIYGRGIEKTELNQIKEIFNSGITFWNYFNVKRDLKGEMYNYSLDNREVWRVDG